MAYTVCNIQFSNIGGGTGTLPNISNAVTVSGLKDQNSVYYVKVDDIITYLGCQVLGRGSTIALQRQGQILELDTNSATLKACFGYLVYNNQAGTTTSYSHIWYADLPSAVFTYNGAQYTPAEIVCKQLGALTTGVKNSKFTIFDFGVNGSTPYVDNNTYIVGGSWIRNWNSIITTNLAPHFKVSELYSKGSSTSDYKQIKIAVSLLSSLESVRHYYRNDTSLSVACAFRGWLYNRSLSGSWAKSFHMRGRAYDIDHDHGGSTLYNNVYTEFKGTDPSPLDPVPGYEFYRTRVSNGKSQGFEIETMPRNNETWLHLQVKPQCDSAY